MARKQPRYLVAVGDGAKTMSRRLPAVGRLVAVLNFFIEHSQQAYTLSQVARSLRLSTATTLSILLGLVEAGYLYRRADKSFVPGPVLHTITAGGGEPFSPAQIAGQEMRVLTDELAVSAAAVFQETDEIVSPDGVTAVPRLGADSPLHDRLGVFLLPLTDSEIAGRLAEVSPPLGDDAKARLVAGVAFARRHGFMPAFMADDASGSSSDANPPDLAGAGLDDATTYRLRSMAVPVVGSAGEVAFAIVLYGFRGAMAGAEIMSVGERLRQTSERISTFIRGKRVTQDMPGPI